MVRVGVKSGKVGADRRIDTPPQKSDGFDRLGNPRPQMGGTERAGIAMPRKRLPRLAAVTAGNRPLTLLLRWQDGSEGVVDVSGIIGAFRVYAPLRDSSELFRQVRLGEHGTDIAWSDEIDMAADTLWRLAQEQSGATMTPDAFRHWREGRAYTLDQAARALGLSRRMIAYYEQGNRPIPRVVALATRGLDAP